MSRKICLLRSPAEIDALTHLRELQDQLKACKITEEQAREMFEPHAANMPDCEHHLHLTRREARKRETQGRLQFLPDWDEWYAQETKPVAIARRFRPADLFSSDLSMGRLEMYSNG